MSKTGSNCRLQPEGEDYRFNYSADGVGTLPILAAQFPAIFFPANVAGGLNLIDLYLSTNKHSRTNVIWVFDVSFGCFLYYQLWLN